MLLVIPRWNDSMMILFDAIPPMMNMQPGKRFNKSLLQACRSLANSLT